MKNKLIYILTIIAFVLNTSVFSQTQTLSKPLNDGSGQLAQKVVNLFNPSPTAVSQQNAMKPFVIGFFGFKALRYANLGIGKLEAMHMDICSLTLQMYDPALAPTFKAIQTRAKTAKDAQPATPQEIEAIRKFVIIEHGGKYLGLGQWFSTKQTEQNKDEMWRYGLGSLLGEMGADITMWYVFPNQAGFDKNMSERLKSISEKIDQAPITTPPDLLNKLKTLSVFGNKQKYTLAEKQSIAEAFKIAVDATMLLAYIPTTAVTAATKTTTTTSAKTPATTVAPTTQRTTPTTKVQTPAVKKEPVTTPTKPGLPKLSQIAPAAVRSRADQLLTQGKELAAANKTSEAIVKYTDATKIDPQYADIYFTRALAYHVLNQTDKAINDANTFIMLEPNNSLGYYNRGIFYLKKQSNAMARDDFSKSIALNPNDARFFYNRGVANFNLADYVKAEADFSMALRLNTNYINAYVSRALVHCKNGLPLSANYDQESAIRLGAKITKGCPK